MPDDRRRPLPLPKAVIPVAVVVLATLALACGNGGNGSATVTTPASTDPPLGVEGNCNMGGGPPSQGEGPEELEGTITYVRLVLGCSSDIYIMDANGDNARALADDAALGDESDLSPDGTTVAFFSGRTGTTLIYTIRTDGSDLRQLTQGDGAEASPRWSPDGSQIAFSRGGNILVMSPDGTGVRTVMQSVSASTKEACRVGSIVGDWSPDGEQILYYSAIISGEGNTFWICVVDVQTGEVEVLVSQPEGALHAEPHWSPDGTKIAFRDDRGTIQGCNTSGGICDYEIFVLDLETGEEANITNNPAFDIEPVWSPDGEWIVFASNRDDPKFDLYIMRPDGTDVQRILNDPESKDSYPSWQ